MSYITQLTPAQTANLLVNRLTSFINDDAVRLAKPTPHLRCQGLSTGLVVGNAFIPTASSVPLFLDIAEHIFMLDALPDATAVADCGPSHWQTNAYTKGSVM